MLEQRKIDLSVCIVNWNTCSKLKRCLESIYNYSENLNIEIIVVDNASTDDSVKMLKQYFPEVKIIINKENIASILFVLLSKIYNMY